MPFPSFFVRPIPFSQTRAVFHKGAKILLQILLLRKILWYNPLYKYIYARRGFCDGDKEGYGESRIQSG